MSLLMIKRAFIPVFYFNESCWFECYDHSCFDCVNFYKYNNFQNNIEDNDFEWWYEKLCYFTSWDFYNWS